MAQPNRLALDTFRAARARREAFDALPDILHDGGRRPPDEREVRKPVVPVLAVAKRPEPKAMDRGLTLDEARIAPVCKARPRDNRGPGGARAFVPWCERKK